MHHARADAEAGGDVMGNADETIQAFHCGPLLVEEATRLARQSERGLLLVIPSRAGTCLICGGEYPADRPAWWSSEQGYRCHFPCSMRDTPWSWAEVT